MGNNICVFCAASSDIADKYFDVARKIGELIGQRGHSLVYGGRTPGLMGTVAEAVKAKGGKVIGVVPELLNQMEGTNNECDELIITDHLRNRKMVMDEKSNAIIALPGGFGTLEELLESLSLKQLGYFDKPIVIMNTDNYYSALLEQFKKIKEERFLRAERKGLYYITEDPIDAINYIENY